MTIRPQGFHDFNGQREVVENLQMAVRSASKQAKPLGHVLLAGPAGLGKTTLALSVLPTEIGCKVTAVNCAAVERPADLTRVLTSIEGGNILFLDELHALMPAAREHLLTAMEDSSVSVRIGEGTQIDILKVDLPRFTIIGATTRQGMLDTPLRSRFQHTHTLRPYDDESMAKIIVWHAQKRSAQIEADAVNLLLGPAHGMTRRAVNLLEACIDTYFGTDEQATEPVIGPDTVQVTLRRLQYTGSLDPDEWRYLELLYEVSAPMGVKSLAAALDESPVTIEEVIEPWLYRQGYVQKDSTGRRITAKGIDYVASLTGAS